MASSFYGQIRLTSGCGEKEHLRIWKEWAMSMPYEPQNYLLVLPGFAISQSAPNGFSQD